MCGQTDSLVVNTSFSYNLFPRIFNSRYNEFLSKLHGLKPYKIELFLHWVEQVRFNEELIFVTSLMFLQYFVLH